MVNICTLSLGDYQTNCYLVWGEDSQTCIVIDPGFEPETVLLKARQLGKKIEGIFLTHGHFDHVGGVKEIAQTTGCSLWMGKGDYTQKKSQEMDFFYPIHDCDFAQICFCEEGEQIQAAGLVFRVMETPGHTLGSVCYLCEDALFSGDTLFRGSCGRTDLPGGSWNTIANSLKRLAALETDYKVYSGHGPVTTLAEEKNYNPYMR